MAVGGAEVIDVACSSLHTGGILHQIGLLSSGQGRRLEPQQLCNILLLRVAKRVTHPIQEATFLLGVLNVSMSESHPDVLFLGGDDALSNEEAVILKEFTILVWVLLALVQQEADYSLL